MQEINKKVYLCALFKNSFIKIMHKRGYGEIFLRSDEYHSCIVDKHDRNISALSPFKTDYPVVSDYLFASGKINISYPDNKKFAVCLTHDIDELYLPRKEVFRQIFLHSSRLEASKALRNTGILLNKNNSPDNNIESIIDLENQYGVNSTFFFLSLEKGEQDYNYNLDKISHIFKNIKQNNSEIGLHAGHDSYCNYKKLISEKDKLEQASKSEIIGVRNHFLKFSNPVSWEIAARAGFKYDSSYGYNDAPGFRNGMCHPFKPYILKEKKYFGITEFPLVLMDCSLDSYMHLDTSNSWMLVKKMIDSIASVNGVFTLLWHNSYFFGDGLKLYKMILDYCKTKDAWMTSCENIYKWWEENSFNTCFYEDLQLP